MSLGLPTRPYSLLSRVPSSPIPSASGLTHATFLRDFSNHGFGVSKPCLGFVQASRNVQAFSVRNAVSSASETGEKDEGLESIAPLVNHPASSSPSSPPPGSSWDSFSSAISGEWDGYASEFNSRGEPYELPEIVVPQAFRDWGIQLYAWQTQCPTFAQPDFQLYTRVIRLLPTVGCEADAATIHESVERFVGSNSASEVLAFKPDGSYSVSPRSLGISPSSSSSSSETLPNVKLEHCLVFSEGNRDGATAKSRVRIVHHLNGLTELSSDAKVPSLRKLEVFKETWYGEFKNGASLGGCSSSGSPFVDNPPMKAVDLSGKWRVTSHSFTVPGNSPNGNIEEKVDPKLGNVVQVLPHQVYEVETKEENLGSYYLFLPKDLWCRISLLHGNNVTIESGWKVNENLILSFFSTYDSNGLLKETSSKHQQRIITA